VTTLSYPAGIKPQLSADRRSDCFESSGNRTDGESYNHCEWSMLEFDLDE
jgi:hypothetical protein